MVSFAHTTHHEATKFRRVFVPDGMRECKEQTAPGESLSKLLSDRGSIPLISTRWNAYSFLDSPFRTVETVGIFIM